MNDIYELLIAKLKLGEYTNQDVYNKLKKVDPSGAYFTTIGMGAYASSCWMIESRVYGTLVNGKHYDIQSIKQSEKEYDDNQFIIDAKGAISFAHLKGGNHHDRVDEIKKTLWEKYDGLNIFVD